MSAMTKGIPNKRTEPPTQDKFAEWVTDDIRKAGATADIVYDRERFCLSQGDKNGSVLFLANAYKEYCSVLVMGRVKSASRGRVRIGHI
jgi:hypothetical protein